MTCISLVITGGTALVALAGLLLVGAAVSMQLLKALSLCRCMPTCPQGWPTQSLASATATCRCGVALWYAVLPDAFVFLVPCLCQHATGDLKAGLSTMHITFVSLGER